MALRVILFLSPLVITACNSLSSMYLPSQTTQSDMEISQRRAEIRAMEMQDYQDERRKRQDSIEDLGKMQMNEAEAINKSYENRSKQNIILVH